MSFGKKKKVVAAKDLEVGDVINNQGSKAKAIPESKPKKSKGDQEKDFMKHPKFAKFKGEG